MTTVDLLYVSHNRLTMTQASFRALLDNTDWNLVNRLLVLDDASTDGTTDWLAGAIRSCPVDSVFHSAKFGGPVAAMLHANELSDADVLAKVDNDLIVCSGWLATMLDVMDVYDELDVLGMEPGFAPPLSLGEGRRGWKGARHVGGLGLIRRRVFKRGRLRQNDRFHGWTMFQQQHARCGWVSPDLPAFCLDRLPFEPWASLAAESVRRGWARAWAAYPADYAEYWAWWTEAQEAVA